MPDDSRDGDRLRPVLTFPPDAVVEAEHLAAAFGVSVDIVETMHLPSFALGKRRRGYLWGQVIDYLRAKAA